MAKMKRLAYAIAMASKWHSTQFRKGSGMPYIVHPLRVMDNVTTESEKIVAVQHDLLEDVPFLKIEDLKQLDKDFQLIPDVDNQLTPEEMDAIVLLTRDPAGDYMEYIEKLSVNPLAVVVKLADLDDYLSKADGNENYVDTEKARAKMALKQKAKEYLLNIWKEKFNNGLKMVE